MGSDQTEIIHTICEINPKLTSSKCLISPCFHPSSLPLSLSLSFSLSPTAGHKHPLTHSPIFHPLQNIPTVPPADAHTLTHLGVQIGEMQSRMQIHSPAALKLWAHKQILYRITSGDLKQDQNLAYTCYLFKSMRVSKMFIFHFFKKLTLLFRKDTLH